MQDSVEAILGIRRYLLVPIIAIENDRLAQGVDHNAAIATFRHMVLDLGAQSGGRGGLILIGMGEQGLATRVLAGKFGSMWTYAGDLTAVGQIDCPTLLSSYRFRTIDRHTTVYGLVGSPISRLVGAAPT